MTKDRLTTDVLVIRMKLNISELNSNVQKDEGDLCLLQLLYWFVKRQSLPQFKLPTDSEIDQVRNEADTIIPRIDKRMNSYLKETFPYIIPTVSV